MKLKDILETFTNIINKIIKILFAIISFYAIYWLGFKALIGFSIASILWLYIIFSRNPLFMVLFEYLGGDKQFIEEFTDEKEKGRH